MVTFVYFDLLVTAVVIEIGEECGFGERINIIIHIWDCIRVSLC